MLSDGSTVLEQALILHNLSAARQLYTNISFLELGSLLDISAEKAERAAANLIEEKRMEGFIDQVGHSIHFSHSMFPSYWTGLYLIIMVDQSSVNNWDSHIRSVCDSLNDIIEKIATSHPSLVTGP